ncbi:MAG: transcription-repair coupling factor [Oscillospiraceae bacterium]|nr:transcription-repair coupling factor [Oscillospiraceae bacterium]
MLALCKALTEIHEIEKLFPLAAEGGLPAAVSGLSHAHKAHLLASIRRYTNKPMLIITPDEAEAARLAADVSALCGEDCLNIPAREFAFHDFSASSREWEHNRIAALYQLAAGFTGVAAATADSVMQRALPPEELLSRALSVRAGQTLPPDSLIQTLTDAGYTRVHSVDSAAQFSSRGGIIDFYPPGAEFPYRIEYYGDEIDTLSAFDTGTQRRLSPVREAQILPAMEFPGNQAPEKFAAILDYIRSGAIIALSEQSRLNQRIENTMWQYAQDIETLLESGKKPPFNWLLDDVDFYRALSERQTLQLDAFTPSSHKIRPRAMFGLTAKQLPSYGGSLETAIGDIAHYHNQGCGVIVLCPDDERGRRLREILDERGLPASIDNLPAEIPKDGKIVISRGQLSAGMEYPALRLAVISEGQFAGLSRRKRERGAKKDNRSRISSYADLKTGDLVVHDFHGIGRFEGMVKIETDGVPRDYVKLSYAGTDILYVPVTKLNLVSKYIGAGDEAPVKLNKLNTQDWQRAKNRAKSYAKDLAKGLIALYAERSRRPGFKFPSDDAWQRGFEEAFPYAETEDQLTCTAEIKADMERPFPMDRLLCGDVGFGKTEVALRAVMKCVLGGKQAAMLVPTTVLAQQHYITAMRRFDRYPVRVDVLSRLRTPKQIKETLKRLQSGGVDLIIGTHKLLQKDVRFSDLGLLVVDEEQRFGVSHKERLKELARRIDVLTLTATPIPRTLNMAMSGIRDMSTIEEAPRDRSPVQTFVLEHNWSILLDAIRREVGRGGQVYYLHNRVDTIDRVTARIQEALPDVSVAAAHGQMSEDLLAEVMREMTDGELQVLVCTTIIETGIDIPNVNTLIVEDADKLGLSQLHQLRGRVGRSPRHAYAYLTYRQGKVLTEVAAKRLAAIREFAEFGSGFKIAMRDLEIRGAGNILGAEQSGQMLSVGYDMYLRLLEEAVLEERGETVAQIGDCTVELSVPAEIPERYVASSGIRMDYYRRIAAVRNDGDAADVLEELIDRFGDVPKPVDTLVQIALLRAKAGALGIPEITQKAGRVYFKLDKPEFAVVSSLCALPQYKGKILFSAGSEPGITLRLAGGVSPVREAREFISKFETAKGEIV